MYDKVTLYLNSATVTNYSTVAESILENLDNVTEKEIGPGQYIKTGFLGGLLVSIYPYNIYISGSLAKYYYGNNVARLDRKNTAFAIERLCDQLHSDITTAKVSSIEFGAVFTLSHPVKEYYARFGYVPNMLRWLDVPGETIYYRTRGKDPAKQLAFYDKSKECSIAGTDIPGVLSNLLRYEMRLKRLPQILQESNITAGKLADNRLYSKIMEKYKENYFAIQKDRTRIIAPAHSIKSSNNAFNLYIAQFLVNKEDDFEQYIKILQASNILSKTEIYRLRQRFEKIKTLNSTVEIDSDIIQELDDDINSLDNII